MSRPAKQTRRANAATNNQTDGPTPAATPAAATATHAAASRPDSAVAAATSATRAKAYPSADVNGQWTRGTPFNPPPAFVPRSSKPLLQLSARPAQPDPPTAAAAAAATAAPAQSAAASVAATGPVEWSTVSGRKRAPIPHAAGGAGTSPNLSHSHASAPGGPLLTLAASVLAARTQGPQRGLLALPIGTLPPANHGLDAAAANASTAAAPQPAKSKASKPHKSWALSELLDLSSLRQLDTITAKRAASQLQPQQSQLQQQQTTQQSQPLAANPPLPSRPSLKPLPAWGATAAAATAWGSASAASASAATAALPVAAAAVYPAATPASLPSALKTQRSASHKSLSSTARSVAFASSDGTAEHRSAVRPRSASVKPLKSSRRAAAAAAEGAGEGAKPPTKRAKPTALKKQLVRERAERLQRFMREEILQPMVQRAMGIAPEPSVPSTPQEAQLQLAALSRRIKKANYEAKKVVHDQRQAEARASKIARIEESRRKRSEQQDAARLTKSQGQAAPLVAAQPGAVAEASVSSDNGAANGSDGVAASPQQLPDAAAAAAAHASSSQTGNNEIHNSSHNECETIEPGSLNQDDTYVAGEEKGDTTAVHGDSDANTSTESGSDAEGEDSESDSECEFVPAAPLPSSSHPLGHLPSATPPQPPPASDVTASSSSSSTSSSAPRLQMFRSQRIPSSLVLTAHEEALLRWHFQSEHHGVQPSLQGAVKRHCKQMFKAHINQQTVAILKELRRFSVRLKERDPKRAALRLTYVSGLKQTSKLLRVGSVRCVVVAANIEANEAAGGLDDLLDEVMDLCEERRVPIVFALDRAKLGHAVGLRNLTSSVAILDYSAVGDAFRQLLGAVSAAQEEWRMLQEDTLLNPRPDGWAEAHAADLAHIAARKAARAAALAAHESAYARAEAERKASLAAQQAAKGGKKKKKSSDSGGGGGGGGGKGRSKRDRELLPLPTLSEEDAKRGRRKGRRGAKRKDQEGGAADAAAAGSGAAVSSGSGAKVATTAAQLKGAGRALSAIAEAMADEQKSAAGPGGGAAAKSAKKGGKQKDVAAPAPAPVVAEDSRSKKKGGGGKSDKKGGKGKSHK